MNVIWRNWGVLISGRDRVLEIIEVSCFTLVCSSQSSKIFSCGSFVAWSQRSSRLNWKLRWIKGKAGVFKSLGPFLKYTTYENIEQHLFQGGKGAYVPLGGFFGGDGDTSSKVQSIQPLPPTIGLGSLVTSFSGSCHPFPTRGSSVIVLNKKLCLWSKRLKSLWRLAQPTARGSGNTKPAVGR